MLLWFFKKYPYLCPFSQTAFQTDLCLMERRSVLDNGKAQACSSRFSGMAFVHPVKTFKDPVLFLSGNANTVIFHSKDRAVFARIKRDFYPAAFPVIFHSVIFARRRRFPLHALARLCYNGLGRRKK